MSNQDSGSRKPFGRVAQMMTKSVEKSDESGYKTPKVPSNETPPTIRGRGQLLAAMAQAAEKKEVAPSLPTVPMGRGQFMARVQTSSDSREKTATSSSAEIQKPIDSTRQLTGGRGKLLNLIVPTEEKRDEPTPPVRFGRGQMMSMIAKQTQAPIPVAREEVPSEISSTTDALAQLRLKEREKSSGSGEPRGPSLQQLQAQAAPFEENEDEVIPAKTGTAGTYIKALTNYIRLEVEPNKGVYEYEVRFEPPVHSNQLRYALLNQIVETIGRARVFDGVKLFLPIRLEDGVTQKKVNNPNDNSDVNITMIYKGKKKFSECQQLYGMLFSNIMKELKFVRFGTKTFDPSQPKVIPQQKLEIWPGYVTAVEDCHDGVMLCVDVTHRVLRQTCVLDTFHHALRSARGDMALFRDNVQKALLGSIVLTRYNNKTYRIDDIDWDQTPMNTFSTKTGEVSYVQYYKQHYNIEIKDLKQPLLISREEKRVSGQTEKVAFVYSIIPEISFLTGLTDEQRADFRVMKDVATHTRISPNQRTIELVQFTKRVNECPATKQLLANWGLKLCETAVDVKARLLPEERVIFANNKSFPVGPNADFGKYSTNNVLMSVVNLTDWIIVHVKSDAKAAKALVENMQRNSRPMGITVSQPHIIVLDNDKNETYAQTLRQALNVKTQIVVCICPNARDDRYAIIKKILCSEIPVPSQVVNAKTLSNEAKNRSIVQKIALQMNCKLGGSLWTIKIPFSGVMIIGIDTHHDKKSGSVSALVASMNDTYTNWFSKAVVQNRNEELVHGLSQSMTAALKHYVKVNGNYPKRIIIFRDGVGDGQLSAVRDYELVQLKQACTAVSTEYQPSVTMVVVQKRINARFYLKKDNGPADNPAPGSVLDNTITRRGLYDFYLVPQCVRQGTVTPTHCVVVSDDNCFEPDHLQRLTYKLCFLYYNWPGTVRVPACCQYAHKLSFLVGQSIKREPAAQLSDRLFYL